MRIQSAIASRLPMVLAMSAILSGNVGTPVLAQSESSLWSGIWSAEGTLLTLKVSSQSSALYIEPQESLGFVWSTGVGLISGDSATIDVQYQGATATILVQMEAPGTAIATPVRCLPDYHVVCVLVQNQQARFIRTAEVAETASASSLSVPGTVTID